MAAKEKESKALPEGQAENPRKGSKVKRIVIILAILLVSYYSYHQLNSASTHSK